MNPTSRQRRAQDLGIPARGGERGANNAITDVAGVLVGSTTLIEGTAVRTGVTVVVPPSESVFAGSHRLNGNGEVTGLQWIKESGALTSPIAITNTHSIGAVHQALVRRKNTQMWHLPVVAETWDGRLNDIRGMHVHEEHVLDALAHATGGTVTEGNVGGGTGMVCHGFKGGIGTASRVLSAEDGGWTVGAIVQANHGVRERLTIDGVPVGAAITEHEVPLPAARDADAEQGSGSIIVVVATDAPLLPSRCERLAQRASFGVALTGGAGENRSGDFFIAFSTGNLDVEPHSMKFDYPSAAEPVTITTLRSDGLTPLFPAVIAAVEEAIVNALLAAETMTGRDGVTAHGLDADRVESLLRSWHA